MRIPSYLDEGKIINLFADMLIDSIEYPIEYKMSAYTYATDDISDDEIAKTATWISLTA